MATNQSPTDPDALLSLVQRIKENYQEPPPPPPKRGKKRDFTALSFLLLAAVAVTLRTVTCHITCRIAARYVTTTIMMPQTAEFPIGQPMHSFRPIAGI